MEGTVEAADLVVRGASAIVTPTGSTAKGGSDQGIIKRIEGAALAIRDGRIVALGSEAEIASVYRAAKSFDAEGGLIIPGLVDAHTHPVFSGWRADEFELRTTGATYLEIAAAGGGIAASLRGVRGTSKTDLVALLVERMQRFLELGTTTVEAKSGYGLSVSDERKCLEAIREANKLHPVDLIPTFLGAHALPPEFRDQRERYVDLVVDEMLPGIAADGLATFCDVFVEKGAFTLGEGRRVLERAKDLGLGLRLHVDQLTAGGGAELAAELGAASADHLEHVTPAGIDALLGAGTVPVLCPLVPLFLREEQEAPGRRMVDAGLPVAIATDFNPGSCNCMSLFEALSWAALRYRLTANEALTAGTLNAAASLGLGSDRGSLEVGKRADLLILDLPDERHVVYELGRNPVRAVLKDGRLVYLRGA
ncbi:MAG: imidazolonepropionase [Planctomycetota bacterium]|jgi:imidazolonepropionase